MMDNLSPLHDTIVNAIDDVAEQRNMIIIEALTEFIGYVPSKNEAESQLELERLENKIVYHWDGKPFLEMYPLQLDNSVDQIGSHKVNFSFHYKYIREE